MNRLRRYFWSTNGPRSVDQQANGCVHWAFQNCRLDATYYDYDGLSHQVIAERKSPAWAANPNYPYSTNIPWLPTGEDRFVATYLYGPMGPISRTAEMGDSDVSNNQESYYLRDAMGGNVGLSYDDDNNTPLISPLAKGGGRGSRPRRTTHFATWSYRARRRPPARLPGAAGRAA